MRIIYTNADGGCSVIVSAPDSGLTIEQVAARSVPSGTPYAIVAAGMIPSDRTYRNAWVADVTTGVVSHDMPKARELHRKYMRRARLPLLAELDLQYLRADERGAAGAADKTAITAQKQAFRDVTALPAIEAAQTITDLKAVWPSLLGPTLF